MLRGFELGELEKATNNFSEDCLLGCGAFGNVYKGNFHLQGTLAIKRARPNSYHTLQEFRNEVRLLAKVKHRNLVALVGFCEQPGLRGEKILVYEYVPNGSLLEYIMGTGGKSLSWRQRVKIAIGAAKGIAYLHEGVKPSIIHRDIKPSNIMIGETFEAKVSDFGLVKLGPVGDQSHVMSSQIKGTPGYLDPAYCSTLHLSPSSDVYSFGVILLQLVTARPVVDTARTKPNYHIIEWARLSIERKKIEEIIDAKLLLDRYCNMEMMLKMAQLSLRCVVKNPKDRPTMTQVWQELEVAFNSTVSFIGKRLSRNVSRVSAGESGNRSMEYDYSQSIVSLDGVKLERFLVEMDSVSFQSEKLRCLEANSFSFDVDDVNNRKVVVEETESENGEERLIS